MKLSKDEVADAIQDFLDGKGGAYDWDDFISIPISDQQLDEIRKICAGLPKTFPPGIAQAYCGAEGMALLRKTVAELKGVSPSAS